MTGKDNYCRDKSAPEGSSLYYATLYETQKNKNLIYTLFALHYELFDCLTVSPDPGVTRMKLHWWHEELGRLAEGVPRHPVSTALAPVIKGNPFVRDYLKQHYLCIESLLASQNISRTSDWMVHWRTALGQLWLCAEKLTGNDSNAAQIICNGGNIFILDILQNFHSLSTKLPGFLPMELLKKNNLRQESLKDTLRQVEVCAMFGELLRDLMADLDAIYPEFKRSDVRPGRYHAIMNRITNTICREILADGNRIMQHKILITPLRKLWISWWTKIRY